MIFSQWELSPAPPMALVGSPSRTRVAVGLPCLEIRDKPVLHCEFLGDMSQASLCPPGNQK